MENLRNKVELIETKIELIKELMDFDKKSNKQTITVSVLGFIVLLISNINNKNLSFISVFSISLFITSVHSMIDKMIQSKRDNELKLRKLEMELDYYKNILDSRAK